MKKLIAAAAGSLLLAGAGAFAGDEHDHATHGPRVVQAAGEMSEGEVLKIDKENKRITLKHGELKNLGMPAMTMVFRVKDPALLDKVRTGAKVRFTADKTDSGAFVVTAIEPAQ